MDESVNSILWLLCVDGAVPGTPCGPKRVSFDATPMLFFGYFLIFIAVRNT